jgi:hypothetical protein
MAHFTVQKSHLRLAYFRRTTKLKSTYSASAGKVETNWLPGKFVRYISATDRPFRLAVVADNGWQADAAPECVRAATA